MTGSRGARQRPSFYPSLCFFSFRRCRLHTDARLNRTSPDSGLRFSPEIVWSPLKLPLNQFLSKQGRHPVDPTLKIPSTRSGFALITPALNLPLIGKIHAHRIPGARHPARHNGFRRRLSGLHHFGCQFMRTGTR
ncbi:hypothetical protein KPB2_5469 [Klebsiella pneumoniae Kb677]|nr:hypothetical protein KPB2_5469 [Klebsiella pneumoniae Kb677]